MNLISYRIVVPCYFLTFRLQGFPCHLNAPFLFWNVPPNSSSVYTPFSSTTLTPMGGYWACVPLYCRLVIPATEVTLDPLILTLDPLILTLDPPPRLALDSWKIPSAAFQGLQSNAKLSVLSTVLDDDVAHQQGWIFQCCLVVEVDEVLWSWQCLPWGVNNERKAN